MPGRRVIVSPQGGGPVRYFGATLPAAIMGVPYVQDVSNRAANGVPPYLFVLNGQTGADSFAQSPTGVITGTPEIPSLLVTDDGSYRSTDTGDIMSVT